VTFLGPAEFVKSPQAMAAAWTPSEAAAYTRCLATTHYENFHVASVLLPRRLRQDFYNIYAYCRWADDLGDEMGDAEESLRLLAWWREELERMYAGQTQHPVFIALRGTAERHGIPMEPFERLIRAFEQDQSVTRYETWADLLNYCRYSANPVGRLVLYLCGYGDAARQELSDATCTALQLANFWQDVAVDWAKGRVYMPMEALRRHAYSLDDLRALRMTPAFANAMREMVARARALFAEGLPLARMVDRRLALDIELFSRGGMRILDKIERQGYDVLSRRPSISKAERVGLLLATLARAAFAQ
jgi:squalene synthase HpnC